MKDLLPILLLSLVTGGCVFLTIELLTLQAWINLVIGIVEGIAIYLTLSRLFRFPEMSELIAIVKRK